MGLWDVITDAADAVGGAVSDAAEAAYDTAAGGAIGDVIASTAGAVDTATFGYAGRALGAVDDYVFDTVDYVTAGAVDVDFDAGRFTVGAGFDGLARVGASVGEDGIGANGEVLLGAELDVSMARDGFSASGSAGIDWGPLPYAEGHVEMLPNGDVKVNGQVQGTFPTPAGLLSGEVSGGFASTADGWGAYYDSEGTLRMPSGTTLRSAQHLSYQETADGSHLSVGLEGSVSVEGVGTVGGSVDYERLEHDGDVVEGIHAEGRVDALGVSASAEADYRHAEVDGVEASSWSGDADVDGPSLEAAARTVASTAASELGGDALGPAADVVPMDDFDAAIQEADVVEQSMDDLVQDLS